MFHEKLSYDETKDYTRLPDQNFLCLWGTTGSEWTSTIAEECLAATNQPIEKGKSVSSHGIILLGITATLLLLSAATLTQPPVTSWILKTNLTYSPD